MELSVASIALRLRLSHDRSDTTVAPHRSRALKASTKSAYKNAKNKIRSR